MPQINPLGIHAERERIFKEGLERWNKLTEGWTEEDREWARKFWLNMGMPWG